MFGKKAETKLETIIGPDTLCQGTIRTKGVVRIDGKLEGGVLEAANVIVGDEGQIQGDINTKKAIIGGTIKGNITATENLEIMGNAQVLGDIHTALLSIAEGAVFEGHCVMMADKSKVIDMDTEINSIRQTPLIIQS